MKPLNHSYQRLSPVRGAETLTFVMTGQGRKEGQGDEEHQRIQPLYIRRPFLKSIVDIR